MSTNLNTPFGITAAPSAIPALRAWDGAHGKPDAFDVQRIQLVRSRWDRQTAALLKRDRTIEENIRMLSGRQWDIWSPVLGQFVDPTRYMPDSEKRWRQRPVVNLLQYWFLLTHARITETPPLITFQPSTADRLDAQLAEVMDTVFKTLWQGDLEMDDRFMEAAAWMLVGGEAYFETCSEYGPAAQQYQLSAPATLSLTADDGSVISRDTDGPVPYGVNGSPLASLVANGDDYGFQLADFQSPDYSGEAPAYAQEGCPKVRVYSPLEVRAEWGNHIPWTSKRWVTCVSYLPPEEVSDLYGVEVKADTTPGSGDPNGGGGYLKRMLFGAGNFQTVTNWTLSGDDMTATEPLVTVYTMWERPDSQVSPETQDSPGGRMLVVTPQVVLHDSARPYRTKGAGPIQRAQFVQQPGRPSASTPLEMMVPLQKTYNRGWAQILEHRNRCTNPILVYDAASGFKDQAHNAPGAMVQADFAATGGRPPAAYIAPPQLSGDVWKTQDQLFNAIMMLGSMAGAEGSAPTDDASGELVAQLRFNSDRPVSVAVRSLAFALAGVADDLVAVLPTCWPAEKTIAYAGEDNVFRTVQVLPEMWEQGHVHARPDIVSAIPESQPARQSRLMNWYMQGVFGPPATPEANQKFLSLTQYPDINRLTRQDGGVDRITCQRFLTQLSQGAPAASLTQYLFPWYKYDVLLATTRDHLASPEFLAYPPQIQQQFGQFFQMLLVAQQTSTQLQVAIAAPQAQAAGMLQGIAAKSAVENGPPQPENESLEDKGPGNGPSSSQEAA